MAKEVPLLGEGWSCLRAPGPSLGSDLRIDGRATVHLPCNSHAGFGIELRHGRVNAAIESNCRKGQPRIRHCTMYSEGRGTPPPAQQRPLSNASGAATRTAESPIEQPHAYGAFTASRATSPPRLPEGAIRVQPPVGPLHAGTVVGTEIPEFVRTDQVWEGVLNLTETL